ncbi:MAG: IS110 family transposase [Candidatus Handelsmanbacteria bacterium]|nr:IS110 family transposase [Candidatus Handelsmanbacteria bacterium]
MHKTFTRFTSVKGIATTSALQLMAALLLLPNDLQPAQWVAQAGLDPRPRESGTAIHKPRFISKTGNKYLRAALVMPALAALRYQPQVKAFYEKLVRAGKKKMQAIAAVMRKLLRCLWGMLKHQQDFDGSSFYQLTCRAFTAKRVSHILSGPNPGGRSPGRPQSTQAALSAALRKNSGRGEASSVR